MLPEVEILRILLAASMLVISSIIDVRKRSVNDSLWIMFGIAGAITYLFGFPTLDGSTGWSIFSMDNGPPLSSVLPVVVSIAIASAVSYGIYKTGLFGGADAIGLVVLAVILPVYSGDIISTTIPNYAPAIVHPFAPIIVLTNAVILSLISVILNLVRNALYAQKKPGKLFAGLESEPRSRKAMAMILGYRCEEQPKFAFPIEKVVNGSREFDFSLRPAETADYASKKDTWVSPGIPFIVYFAAGFVFMIFFGDIMALFLAR